MPIVYNRNSISRVYHGTSLISKVYYGSNLIYSSSPVPPSEDIQITSDGKGMILKKGLVFKTMDWSSGEPQLVDKVLSTDVTLSSILNGFNETYTDETTGVTTDVYYQFGGVSTPHITPKSAKIWSVNAPNAYFSAAFTLTPEQSMQVIEGTMVEPSTSGSPHYLGDKVYVGVVLNKSDLILGDSNYVFSAYLDMTNTWTGSSQWQGTPPHGRYETTIKQTSDSEWKNVITRPNADSATLTTAEADLTTIRYYDRNYISDTGSDEIYLLFECKYANTDYAVYYKGLKFRSFYQYQPAYNTLQYLSISQDEWDTNVFLQISSDTEDRMGTAVATFKVAPNGTIYDLVTL